jgi:fatty-acyl-CoA synthase
MGYVDSDGYCYITVRIRDMIIRGGENLYPAEIEAFLLSHPKILDVQVVGIQSWIYGEEPVAFIRLKPGVTSEPLELKQFCRSHISIEKVPATLFFVDAYPLTVSGKVQKYRLREIAQGLLADH